MCKYKIWLDQPASLVHVAVRNLGAAVHDKDGLFTVRLVDENQVPLEQEEYNLPLSKQLGENYIYVSATEAGGLIKLGQVSAKQAFQGIHVEYVAAFTDRPLSSSSLGPLFYSASSTQEDYTITKLVMREGVLGK